LPDFIHQLLSTFLFVQGIQQGAVNKLDFSLKEGTKAVLFFVFEVIEEEVLHYVSNFLLAFEDEFMVDEGSLVAGASCEPLSDQTLRMDILFLEGRAGDSEGTVGGRRFEFGLKARRQ
jgi:hypothetical protein